MVDGHCLVVDCFVAWVGGLHVRRERRRRGRGGEGRDGEGAKLNWFSSRDKRVPRLTRVCLQHLRPNGVCLVPPSLRLRVDSPFSSNPAPSHTIIILVSFNLKLFFFSFILRTVVVVNMKNCKARFFASVDGAWPSRVRDTSRQIPRERCRSRIDDRRSRGMVSIWCVLHSCYGQFSKWLYFPQ